MAYDFIPNNKKADSYQIGAFSWPLMLDAGLGLVLGTGKGFSAGQFIYITRPDGLCVQYNDGAKVTRSEATDLAKVARWIAAIQFARIRQWEGLPKDDRDRMRADKYGTYNLPWDPKVAQRFIDFADWCEKSGGFSIH